MMYCERGAVERVVYGSDRYRPLPLQTPGRNRAKGREWARLPAPIAPDPFCASPAGQYIPTTFTRQKAGAFTGRNRCIMICSTKQITICSFNKKV